MPTLIVEDGTGKVDSNTYIDLSDFRTYFTNIGVDTGPTTGDDLSDAQVESALYETGLILMEICFTWKGEISYPDTPQNLSWPREGLYDRKGLEIAKNTIPKELQWAQAEMARTVAIDIKNGERYAYSDDPTNLGAVKKDKLDVLETEYYGPGSEVNTNVSKTVSDYVRKLLQPWLAAGNNPFQVTNVATY